MIDTHCHLDAHEFDTDRADVLARAQAAGVAYLVVPAVNVDNFAAVRAICDQFPACLPAWGLHPVYEAQHKESDLQQLDAWLHMRRPLAIGEIGLDGWDKRLDFSRQEYFFSAQLELARSHGLPVLLHLRHAVDAGINQLRRHGIRRGIAHAFNGSLQQAERLIDMGFKLGFGGAATYSRALNLRRLVKALPLSSIVLETDAPDMSPQWAVGQRNSPEYLPRIAAELAALRDMDVAALVSACTDNTRTVLDWHD